MILLIPAGPLQGNPPPNFHIRETVSQAVQVISLLGTKELLCTELKHQHAFPFSVAYTSIFGSFDEELVSKDYQTGRVAVNPDENGPALLEFTD